MDSRPRTTLIAGATGLVGAELLDLLLADPEVARVHSLVRRPSGRANDALAEQVVDFSNLAAAAIAPPVDEAYCCLGTTMRAAGSRDAFRTVDFELVVAFARLALRLGAASLTVISSLGAHPGSRSFYLRTKGEVERELIALGLPSLGIVRPSLLLGQRRELRFGEFAGELGLRLASPLLKGSLARYRPVHARTVACAMAELGRRGEPGVHVLESDDIQQLGTERP
ncbi:MAG: hypothetical protein C3F15_09975 [Holophagae bacterium]|nr:MAG: hypothetical protein C3F15_09975 [Holophagae bacterium]